ncbi:MAG: phosphate/phosphite/phosphonate ABC transporter substrate-binding protein [Ilumatobacteraceae bacterium]|nr:phosphate/phosphite/phosphonate ABC transporter substrate-binding protein [Ilumatobacteraceae bacterium]
MTLGKLMRWWGVLAVIVLLAAACGDDSDDGAADVDDTTADTTDDTTDDTADADTDDMADAAVADERPADWPDTIVFGAVPAEAASSLEADFATTRAILTDELGLSEIEFFQASDYAGVIEGIIAERVDVAQFGGFSYVIATNNGADISVAGVMTDGPDVEPGYRSYAVVQPGSDIRTIEDFAGRTVCFVDPGSTSGFLFPSEGLLAAGLDPSETSSDITPTFAGGHDASAISVANGDCDAGFAYDSMVTAQLIESGDISGVIDSVEDENVNPDDAALEIIWKSQVISGAPMAITNSLPASFVEAFQEVVTTKVNAEWAIENGYCSGTLEDNDCSFADEEDTWGFVEKDDSFYDGIRQVCEITQASKCQ